MVFSKKQGSGLESVIRGQLTSDPQLPRTQPTPSLWQSTPHKDVGHSQSAKLPRKVDYAIIGSGIAALGVARSLLTNDATGSSKITVFEARGLCSGATGRNGGQLTRLPPTRHAFMEENFGIEQANKIMRYTVRGLQEMHKAAEAQGPEFEKFSRRTKVEKFFAYYDEKSWKETIEALKLFEEEVPEDKAAYQLVSKEETASNYNLNGTYGGLKLAAGVCSPYNLVTGTFKALLDKYGARFTIETNTPVTGVSHQSYIDKDYPYLVQTPRGSVRAANVVHCTNGHAGHLLPNLRGKMYPRRATMSVQGPGKQFPNMSTKQSWSFYFSPKYSPSGNDVETGRYYAFQHKDTGDIWVGGDRDNIDGFISADDSEVDAFAEKNIRGILPRLFNKKWMPAKGDVRAVWSGIMCYTGDQLPLVGKLPASATGRQGQGEWIAAGWNTYGMTNGLISGDALGKMMLGQNVSDYFPEAYLPTEERLNNEKFQLDAVLQDYFTRIGAEEVAQEIRAKL